MKIRNMYLFGLLLLSLLGTPLLAQEEEAADLRIGILPTLYRLPFYVAEDVGYFEAAGLTVEMRVFNNGSGDMQSALLAGELDGFIADVADALQMSEAGVDLRLVRHLGVLNMPNYAIVVGPGSELENAEQLAGKRIGISRDARYLADALLTSVGVSPDDVEYVDLPGLPVRYEQSILRQIDAGLLPEPFVQLSHQYGTQALLDDLVLDYVPQTIGFRADVLGEQGEAVRAFLHAWEQAVATVNSLGGDTGAYRDFLASINRDPAENTIMEGTFFTGQLTVPVFARASLPSEADFAAVQDWALSVGMVEEAQAYADIVDGSLLPEVNAEALAADEAMLAEMEESAPETVAGEMAEPDLRIGLLPVLNTLPVYVAYDAGYFEEEGLVVELTLILSAKELTAAVLAGELDGLQADLVSALRMNASGGEVRVVRHVGITNQPFVSLMVSPRSGIETAADLAEARIALSHNTIIQYLTDTLLASAGMSADDVEYVEVAKILVRYNDLLRGNIDAASLPEPFASIAASYGARTIIDDSVMSYVPEALSLRADVLAEKGEEVRAFLRAYERAVETLNAMEGDNDTYLGFSDEIGMKPNTAVKSMVASGALSVPSLALASVPSAEDYATVHEWALGVGLLEEAQAYEDVIDGSYLPEMMADDMSEEDEE